MEIIKEIKELTGSTGYDGFEVVTSEQTIFLGIDNSSGCCENWGHFFCNDDVSDFIGAEVRGVSVTDTALNNHKVEAALPYGLDDGGIMFVNIETDRGVLQFVAYNSHNGYYGHTAKVECRQLNHSECL
jgi:hypothetical protein